MINKAKFILYAPNVNSGGGLELLLALLLAWDDVNPLYAILDRRIVNKINSQTLPNVQVIFWAKNNFFSSSSVCSYTEK